MNVLTALFMINVFSTLVTVKMLSTIYNGGIGTPLYLNIFSGALFTSLARPFMVQFHIRLPQTVPCMMFSSMVNLSVIPPETLLQLLHLYFPDAKGRACHFETHSQTGHSHILLSITYQNTS